MPDHMHGLFEAADERAHLLKFAAMFKQRAAFHLKRARPERLWQEGFYERVLRNEESALDVAAYIIQNPVRAGLRDTFQDYPFVGSSRYSIRDLLDAIAWRP